MSVINLNEANFETEVLKSDKPVLVDFFAVWCGPCKMISPIIDEIAEERQDIKVCKVNVDEAPALAERFSVSSSPTIAVFKNGKLAKIETGARPKPAILALID